MPGRHLAVEDDVGKRLAVDGGFERLAHARVLAERAVLSGLAVGEIEGKALVADLDLGGELELGIGLDLLEVGRQRALDQVEAARLEVGKAHRRFHDRPEHDPIDVDIGRVPIVGELLQHDAILLHALDELEGTGANRLQAELVAGFLAIALGLRIMPARSASWAISGEKGFFSCSRTVAASATSTLSTAASSGLRNEPCMRHMPLEARLDRVGIHHARRRGTSRPGAA